MERPVILTAVQLMILQKKNEPGRRLIELLERVVLISVRPFFKTLFS